MVKSVPIIMSDEEYVQLKELKGDRTWRQVLFDGCGKKVEE